MTEYFTAEALSALVTLTAMETILGIDNIVFISILVGKLPAENREKIRKLGIFLALFMRLLLLFSISWVISLKDPLFTIFSKSVSGRDLILLGGGLFLIAKATYEIHSKIEGAEVSVTKVAAKSAQFVLFQIIVLDVVFSLDSVITAVGMASQIWIMVLAMVFSMLVMLMSAKSIGSFVENNPTIKILALSFLLLIGVMLVAEGMGQHISKGYIYFAMSFSLIVELLNMRYRTKKLVK